MGRFASTFALLLFLTPACGDDSQPSNHTSTEDTGVGSGPAETSSGGWWTKHGCA